MTRPSRPNPEFELRGVHHLALVCRDMAETVEFYSTVLGMPLVKTVELPFGMGQHFFFDAGNGDALAFFYFPHAPEAQPGIASAAGLPGIGDLTTAIGSMNHVAFDVPPERLEEYAARLRAKGVPVSEVINHDDSELGISKDVNTTTFVRSIYFFDPNGILLEFASWTRPLTEADVRHAPARRTTQGSPAEPAPA